MFKSLAGFSQFHDHFAAHWLAVVIKQMRFLIAVIAAYFCRLSRRLIRYIYN